MSKAPYKHGDGSDCYTVNCSRGHYTSSDSAISKGDINGYMEAKMQENQRKTSPERIRRENFFLTMELAPTFCDFSSDRTAYITVVDQFDRSEDGTQEGYVLVATQLDYNEERVDDTKFYVRKKGSEVKLYKDSNSSQELNDSEIFNMFMESRKNYNK